MFQWYLISNSKVFIEENVLENVGEMAAICLGLNMLKTSIQKVGQIEERVLSTLRGDYNSHSACDKISFTMPN